MKRYFTNCKTAEEAKEQYRKLAKQLHPDCGGDPEEFKAMSAEFTETFNRLKNTHASSKNPGETYTKETTETAERYMNIINSLLKVDLKRRRGASTQTHGRRSRVADVRA